MFLVFINIIRFFIIFSKEVEYLNKKRLILKYLLFRIFGIIKFGV